LDDVWANFERIQKAHEEGMKAHEEGMKEIQKAHEEGMKEIQKAQDEGMRKIREAHQETEKALGRLSNKMGDMAEYTLLPNLPEKFRKFDFTFQVINRNRKIADEEHDIYAEVDAFLENSNQAMAVEVKTTLRHEDVDDHIKRMEKIRRYADLHNDKRQFFGAIAAIVIDEDAKRYALKQGFYVIEPSGEDVKILKPASEKVW
jgi:F0F1-type ATP synthase membrane subunit b/b'